MLALIAWDLPFGPSVVLWIALSDVIYLAVAIGSDRLREVVSWVALAITVVIVPGLPPMPPRALNCPMASTSSTRS